MNELYTVVATVLNSSGAGVVGANVLVTDNVGVSRFTGTSTTGGAVPTGTVWNRQWYFDPFNAAYPHMFEKSFNPYTVLIRNYGYVFQTTSATIATRFTSTFTIQTNVNVVASSATAAAYTSIAITGSAKTVVLSGAHTLQELYDYNEYWAALSANMGYAEPLATTDGLTYIFATGWTFTGVANLTLGAKYLSGGTIVLSTPGTVALNLSTTTLSFSVAGTYDLTTSNLSGTITVANTSGGSVIINALPGVTFVNSGPSITINQTLSVNLVLTNVVVGSRYDIFNANTSAVETDPVIATGTAASSTITIAYTYTVNVPVIIRVRKSSAQPKYQPFETQGTITSTGLSTFVSQILDTSAV